MALIEARNLTKVYTMGDQTVHALRDVSFDIDDGRVRRHHGRRRARASPR